MTHPRAAFVTDPVAPLLPPIPALPEPFRRLAQHQLGDPRTTSDHLLIMADGLAEAADAADMQAMAAVGTALRTLAAELRGLAPRYQP